ncbi:LOW QUALITY PROTEIN: hypothetical protein PHMEG_00035032 [Phytophthora megakarya]|uniref:Reverse transcriptase/retrotransposon-derived protein RNase H-like domain-containing protein n=1 Tax=Phytophthora megakarya TaxID=4795 RepID=A0A225US95_9STRA|nr:LOW QUALITY PROTEIN: hypothetical protein PHMEG_00035032 [Phytophthora megakarya]
MPQFLGAPNYNRRFIKDFAVFGAALYQLKDEDFETEGNLSAAKENFRVLQRKVAEAPILKHFDDKKEVHVMLYANEWALRAALLQIHDDKLHPVQFGKRVLKDAEMNYLSAEKEVLALLLLLKACYTQLAGKTLHAWVHKSKSQFGRAVQFAVMLSPWQLEVQSIREKDCLFSQLRQSTITNFVDLDESLAMWLHRLKDHRALGWTPVYCMLNYHTITTDSSFPLTARLSPKRTLPEWHIVITASAYLEVTTMNMAEYNGINNGLVIQGCAIQQSLGVIVCRKDSLVALLNRHQELTAKLKSLHGVREYNAAADTLAGKALETNVSKVVLNDNQKSELIKLYKIEEMSYKSSSDENKVTKSESENFVQIAQGIARQVSVPSGEITDVLGYHDCNITPFPHFQQLSTP